MLPKLSAPLIKDIRTGEGIAEWALGAAVSVLSACGDISLTKGISTLTILAVLKSVRRTLLKAVAVQKGAAGVGQPTQPHVLSEISATASAAVPAVETVLTEIGRAAPPAQTTATPAPEVSARPETAIVPDAPPSAPPPGP